MDTLKDKGTKILPGLLAAAALAICAVGISRLLSAMLHYVMGAVFHISVADDLIEGSIIALVAGMLLNKTIVGYPRLLPGVQFAAKYILRAAIVLLGLTLSFSQVVSIGRLSLIVMSFTLFTSFIGGNYIGKLFGVSWRLRALLSAGTGICGGSAIAAIAPVIQAEDSDVTYALSATYIFDVAMVIAFPLIGHFLGMSDSGFGIWTGTAVNDTSSVVAAGYAFSSQAGEIAIVVKLTRTLSIIPAVLIFSYIGARARARELPDSGGGRLRVDWRGIFPFFILLFLLMVAIKSSGLLGLQFTGQISVLSKFLMLIALAAIGMKTSRESFASKGRTPLVFAIGIDLLVTVVAYLVQGAVGAL